MARAVVIAALVALASVLLPWISIPPADPTSGDPTITANLLAGVPGFLYADMLLVLPIITLALGIYMWRRPSQDWVAWIAAVPLLVATVISALMAFWIQNSDPQVALGAPAGAWHIGSGAVVYLAASALGLLPALGATALFSGWVTSQFTTRVIVLMPVAIALNIVLGYIVQSVLKLPIYLDSIGTILVGVLAGPLAGLLTGVLSNLIWQYAPGIGGGTIGPFAIVAGVIGVLAGIWGYLSVYRSRPASGGQLLAAAVIAALVVVVVAFPIFNNPAYTDPNIGGYPDWVFTAAIVIALVAAVVVGTFIYLKRDLAGLWVAIAGVATGIIAAFISAPISAIAFNGVTGSGTDLIVAALRSGGSGVLQASLGQGLFSDPVDKLITSFVVFMILGSLSSRYVARFPLGERLIRPAMTLAPGVRSPAPAVPKADEEDQ